MLLICFPGLSPLGQARAQFNIVWHLYNLNSSHIASNLSFVYSSRLSIIHLQMEYDKMIYTIYSGISNQIHQLFHESIFKLSRF